MCFRRKFQKEKRFRNKILNLQIERTIINLEKVEKIYKKFKKKFFFWETKQDLMLR